MSHGLLTACQLRQYDRNQLFTELDTPLIESIDTPNDALHEYFVLIQGD